MRIPFNGNFRLTQGFGENPASYARFNLKGHNGLDYGLPTGTQVVAPHDGKVIEVAYDATGYGNYVKIENNQEGSVLAHFQSFQVKVGEIVSEGQPIALSDNTGNSTGPHLHWGYYTHPRNRANGYAGFIDQLPLLNKPADDTQKIIDELRTARDKNWTLYLEQVEVVKQKNYQIDQLKEKLSKAQALAKQICDL